MRRIPMAKQSQNKAFAIRNDENEFQLCWLSIFSFNLPAFENAIDLQNVENDILLKTTSNT